MNFINTRKLWLLCTILVSLALDFRANPGDTTWVTIYNQRKITQYGNYDTSAVLPTGKTYRKMRLHYILGRYACPAGSQYCGSWDYTTQVYAKPAGADTVEIARVITPYATDWLNTNRTHDYSIDVSDYASILNGNLDFRYKYDGYSWGFTVTLKLEMIEGTPPMYAYSARNIYDGYFPYGNASNPIENYLVEKPLQYQNPATWAVVKNTISGHGSDDSECAEFCSKYYNLKLNGSQLSQKQLWRSDCGLNDIYPQTGTWLYERANWCPGNVVLPIVHNLSGLTSAANTFSVDIDMESYTAPNQSNASAGYNMVSQLISYSAPNFNTDLSIEDVISPTNDPNYYRSNPICTNPKIKIKNTGANPVTQAVFNFNLNGGALSTYTWTGTLNFLEETVVDLGSSFSTFMGNNSNQFEVAIAQVNGISGDENAFNDTYRTTFVDVKSYPSKFVVLFYPNAATSSINPGFNEAHWTIRDASGTIVYSRTNALNNTTYRDTVNLPSGCYTFTMDDDGCDGISWWAYQYYTPNPGTGYVRFTAATGLPIPLKNFNGDFGCQITERFTVGYVLDANNPENVKNGLQVFPVPAANTINLLFDLKAFQTIEYTMVDITGKQVLQGSIPNAGSDIYPLNTKELADGIYFVKCRFANGDSAVQKVIIQK